MNLELYFKEIKKEKRKALLEQLENVSESEKKFLQNIFEKRYAKREKEVDGIDYFILSFVTISTYVKHGGGLFAKGIEKEAKKISENLLINEIDAYGEKEKEFLYKEYCNSARLYYTLCKEDKSYGSKLFGMMSMNKEELNQKMRTELDGLKKDAAPKLKLEKELVLFFSAYEEVMKEFTE
ncbi:MAG: DUF6553 family protein [Lachnospiraceae bacterium]